MDRSGVDHTAVNRERTPLRAESERDSKLHRALVGIEEQRFDTYPNIPFLGS